MASQTTCHGVSTATQGASPVPSVAPSVSVVIPLYNKRLYIARAVEAVLGQTVRDFELIVVDDGSTDGSGEVVATFKDDRIKLIRRLNGGQSAARNTRILEPRGASPTKRNNVSFQRSAVSTFPAAPRGRVYEY